MTGLAETVELSTGTFEQTKEEGGIKLLPVTTEQQVFDCAALAIEVFFQEEPSLSGPLSFVRKPWRTYLLRSLYVKLAGTMLKSLGQPYRQMLQAVDTLTGSTVGYAEVHLSAVGPVFDELTRTWLLSVAPDAKMAADSGTSQPKIANVAVSPAARKSGVGSRLLAVVLDAARGWGFRDVYLTVEPSNQSAVQFYQKRGFRQRFVTLGSTWDVNGLALRRRQERLVVMSRALDTDTPGTDTGTDTDTGTEDSG